MKKAVLISSVVITMFLSIVQPFSISADSFSDNYYELDYIQSSGSEYLISSIPSVYGIFEMEVEFPQVYSTLSRFIGSQVASNNQRVPLLSRGSTLGFGYVSTYKDGFSYNANVNYIIKTVLNSGTGTTSSFTVDNNLIVSQNFPTAQTLGSNVYMDIFGYYQSSNNTHTASPAMRLYYLKRWDINNNLTHFYVPAMRKSDNKVGLYNHVNGEFIFTSNDNFDYDYPIPSRYTISTSVSPAGSGTVTGGGEYDANTTINLTAVPNTGYEFLKWSDNIYDNPRSVLVNSSQSFTAIFTQQDIPIQQYTISTSVSPAGSGTVTGGGTYDSGSTITITASANNGYIFSQWSDGVTSASRSVNVTGNMSFTAQFVSSTPPAQTYVINASASPSAGGSVSGGGSFQYGDIATLTATANSGYVFSSWSDGITANPRNISVTSNMNLTAYFTQDVSNQIIIGVNVSVIDYSNNNSIQYWGNMDSNGNIILYPQPYDNTYPAGGSAYIIPSTYVYYFDFVFNDDYIGDFGFRFNATGTALNRTIYVNGSHAQISFAYDKGYDLTEGTFVFYNLNHLIKKQTTQSLIQDGTQDTIESSNALDNSNSDLLESSDTYNELESGFNNDMNSALDDIDTQFNPSSFGSKFQASAIWVSDQFNELTSDSPFGSFMGFSLLLGLSLLIIGRVFG